MLIDYDHTNHKAIRTVKTIEHYGLKLYNSHPMIAEVIAEVDYPYLSTPEKLIADPVWQYVQLAPNLAYHARRWADHRAVSYRNFNVGAAAMVLRHDDHSARVGILAGANYKPDPDTQKVCAEMAVLELAESLRYEQVIGFVVAGTSDRQQIEAVTMRDAPTLHPCEACRSLFSENDMMHDEALFMTVGDREDRFQLFSQKELLQHYASYAGESDVEAFAHHFDDADFVGWLASRAMYSFIINNPGARRVEGDVAGPVYDMRAALLNQLEPQYRID